MPFIGLASQSGDHKTQLPTTVAVGNTFPHLDGAGLGWIFTRGVALVVGVLLGLVGEADNGLADVGGSGGILVVCISVVKCGLD